MAATNVGITEKKFTPALRAKPPAHERERVLCRGRPQSSAAASVFLQKRGARAEKATSREPHSRFLGYLLDQGVEGAVRGAAATRAWPVRPSRWVVVLRC